MLFYKKNACIICWWHWHLEWRRCIFRWWWRGWRRPNLRLCRDQDFQHRNRCLKVLIESRFNLDRKIITIQIIRYIFWSFLDPLDHVSFGEIGTAPLSLTLVIFFQKPTGIYCLKKNKETMFKSAVNYNCLKRCLYGIVFVRSKKICYLQTMPSARAYSIEEEHSIKSFFQKI